MQCPLPIPTVYSSEEFSRIADGIDLIERFMVPNSAATSQACSCSGCHLTLLPTYRSLSVHTPMTDDIESKIAVGLLACRHLPNHDVVLKVRRIGIGMGMDIRWMLDTAALYYLYHHSIVLLSCTTHYRTKVLTPTPTYLRKTLFCNRSTFWCK